MTTVTVVGSDSIAPVYNENGLWKIWNLFEIWMGPGTIGQGKYVPKVKDLVYDTDNLIQYTVDHLDPVTLIPTLRAITFNNASTDLTDEETLFGIGIGPDPKTMFAFLNDTVMPYTLRVDSRYTTNGSMNSYARIFKGSDTSLATGDVISKMYDASGNYIGDKVPLELVKVNSHTNYLEFCIKGCNVTEKMKDGEKITAVVYSDNDNVVSRHQFLIENTDTVADLNTDTSYITGIYLESSFMSPTVPNQINFPLNLPLDSLDLMLKVQYTDKTVTIPVDGSKARVLGLDGYVSSIPGQPLDLAVVYQLSPGETAYAINGVQGDKITKGYKLITTNVDYSVAVKLFGYPIWISEAEGYHMRWYLLNLARNVWFEATGFVKFDDNFGAFDPKLYGYIQKRSVSVNLRDVSSAFIPFIHTQLVDIVLNGKPDKVDNWKVANEINSGIYFGMGVYGVRKDNKGTINLAGSFTDQASWLQAYYLNTLPMYDKTTESAAPSPSHFIVNSSGTETEWDMSYWNQDISINTVISDWDTVSIRFIKRQSQGDLQLSVAAALVRPAS